MNKKIVLSLCSVAGMAVCMFTSCHSNNNSSTVPVQKDTTATVKTQPSADTDNIMLPSPLQIGSIFKNAGLVYVAGLTNSIKETTQYTTSFSQALNMGVYGADLSYCVLNKQSQEALNYLKLLRSLADKLGFGSVFESNNMAKRFQDNLNSEDSLSGLIADLQMNADTYLTTNKEKYISSVTFAGAWVESMYIGSKVYDQKKNANVSQRISEQMNILDNLLKSLNNHKGQDTHIADLISSLKGIQDTYMGYDEVKGMGKDTDQFPKLTDAHISELSKALQQLRDKIIMI
jgi:hypothetical protein